MGNHEKTYAFIISSFYVVVQISNCRPAELTTYRDMCNGYSMKVLDRRKIPRRAKFKYFCDNYNSIILKDS